MAEKVFTITPTEFNDETREPRSYEIMEWTGIKDGDTCYPEFDKLAGYSMATVHVFGTWGGASLSLTGRNSASATALVMKALNGDALTFTADGINNIRDMVQFLGWSLTGGDANTNLTIQVALF
jgi:hypothetical protein